MRALTREAKPRHTFSGRPVQQGAAMFARPVVRARAKTTNYPAHQPGQVVRSPNRVNLVRNPHMAYFTILRQKLHWGER